MLNDKIPIYQFSFQKQKSTVNTLIALVNNMQVAKLQGKKSAAVFLDIEKAFDSVWHKGLIYVSYTN